MSTNRVLLIEDDPDTADMLLLYFQSRHFETFHAESGSEGIELARTRFPNVILLDLMLPDMDGYDVCSQLRQIALTKYIPMIFLTRKDDRSAKVRGLELGADDYITKPFDVEELVLRVEGSIRRATQANQHEARTGLPTGTLAIEELVRLREHGAHIIRFSLTGFDAYADVYSFMAASDVMYHAGRTIREALGTRMETSFVGILGNDFYVGIRTPNVQAIEEMIFHKWQELVKTFYTYSDAEQGGIRVQIDTPSERMIPLMSFITYDDILF